MQELRTLRTRRAALEDQLQRLDWQMRYGHASYSSEDSDDEASTRGTGGGLRRLQQKGLARMHCWNHDFPAFEGAVINMSRSAFRALAL